MDRIQFLSSEFLSRLKAIDPLQKGKWGVMSFHHMVEHMAIAFRMANGKDLYPDIVTAPEKIERMQAFILSDIPFKENTRNVLLPTTPLPIRHLNIEEAFAELGQEIQDFFIYFQKNPDAKINNPIFGELDYNHWVHLLAKHATHHLLQFGG